MNRAAGFARVTVLVWDDRDGWRFVRRFGAWTVPVSSVPCAAAEEQSDAAALWTLPVELVDRHRVNPDTWRQSATCTAADQVPKGDLVGLPFHRVRATATYSATPPATSFRFAF